MGQLQGQTVTIVAPNPRFAWDEDKPYRIRYYNPKKRGVWHRYCDTVQEATEFAAGHRLYSEPCVVELSPRHALEAK